MKREKKISAWTRSCPSTHCQTAHVRMWRNLGLNYWKETVSHLMAEKNRRPYCLVLKDFSFCKILFCTEYHINCASKMLPHSQETSVIYGKFNSSYILNWVQMFFWLCLFFKVLSGLFSMWIQLFHKVYGLKYGQSTSCTLTFGESLHQNTVEANLCCSLRPIDIDRNNLIHNVFLYCKARSFCMMLYTSTTHMYTW